MKIKILDNPNLFKGGAPDLILETVPYFSLKKLSPGPGFETGTFQLHAKMTNLKSGYTYKAEPTGNACAPAAGPMPPSAGSEFAVNFESSATGLCEIKVTVTPDNGAEITRKISLNVVEESEKLILEKPDEGISLNAGLKLIPFKWLAPNAPQNQLYTVKVVFIPDGGISVTKEYPSVISPFAYNGPNNNGLEAGNYSWSVKYTDSQGTYWSPVRTFIVPQPVTVNFKATDQQTEILPFSLNQVPVTAPPPPSVISLKIDGYPPSLPPGYKYEWMLTKFATPTAPPTSQSFIGTINASGLTPGASMYSAITLTVRDGNGNAAGTMTKGITVMKYPELTQIGFSPPVSAVLSSGMTSYTIPPDSLKNNIPAAIGDIPLDKCDSLAASTGASISGNTVTFAQPVMASYTITCKISAPKIIKGHMAVPPLEATLTLANSFAVARASAPASQTYVKDASGPVPALGMSITAGGAGDIKITKLTVRAYGSTAVPFAGGTTALYGNTAANTLIDYATLYDGSTVVGTSTPLTLVDTGDGSYTSGADYYKVSFNNLNLSIPKGSTKTYVAKVKLLSTMTATTYIALDMDPGMDIVAEDADGNNIKPTGGALSTGAGLPVNCINDAANALSANRIVQTITVSSGSTCGNGIIESPEACDDKNTTSGDGCEAPYCIITPGWSCTTNPTTGSSVCQKCGNGIIEGTEECDPLANPKFFPADTCLTKAGSAKPYGELACGLPGSTNACKIDTSGCMDLYNMCNYYPPAEGPHYFDTGNNICWLLGATGQNCDSVCAKAHPTGDTQTKLACTTIDWNDCGANGICGSAVADADDCAVCEVLTNTPHNNCTFTSNVAAPYFWLSYCRYRTSSFPETNCTTPIAGKSRICKCQ